MHFQEVAYNDVFLMQIFPKILGGPSLEWFYRIPQGTIKTFFDLSLDAKLGYEIPELAGQRGYTSFGREHAKGMTEADFSRTYYHPGSQRKFTIGEVALMYQWHGEHHYQHASRLAERNGWTH